jgi:uncharacterized membrane protein
MTTSTTDQMEAALQVPTSMPSRVEMSEPLTTGERIADNAARVVGSWRFIITQTILVAIWIAFNVWELGLGHYDPFPFVLLNLMFSVQAAYTGPILLLANNRQATKDRALAQRDDEELGVIFRLQQEQMEILSLLRDAQAKHADILEIVRNQTHAVGKPQVG